MSEKEIKKLGEEVAKKISGGVESLKKKIKHPGAIFAKRYGAMPIRPPIKPTEPVKPIDPANQPEQPAEPLAPANPVQPLEPKKEENK